MQKKEYSTEIGGKTLIAQFSDLTDQANGSVILKYGETVVLATAVMSKSAKDGMNFFPLTVDYEEKFYAAGQILGSRFMRRESKPSEEATLTGRVVDRTIRPLFDQHIRNEIQVIVTVLSIGEDDPDVLAVNAASLALGVSDIPWNGPVSSVRIVREKESGSLVVNPPYSIRNNGIDLETLACGKNGNINMIEAGAQEISDEIIHEALSKASEEIEKLQEFQKKIIGEIGKQKVIIKKDTLSQAAQELFTKEIEPKLESAVFSGAGKEGIHTLEEAWFDILKENLPEEPLFLATEHYEEAINDLLHKEAIEKERRADGRKLDEIRNIFAGVGGISNIVHGSGIFYRGGTHVLSVLTLGGPGDSQIFDGIEVQEKKHFLHHYNFPPFSVGETGRLGINRRMIGHGALAEKALSYVIPPQNEFPYTIRIVSESMASNGSTSMASVCAGTLALMDAGVPIKAPVAGMAMGLMMNESGAYKVLTDIQGPEDHHGDMDLKVAGTRRGITAIQMDVKVDGVPIAVLVEAFQEAKKARLYILDVIEKTIPAPRPNISPSAPKIISFQIKQDQIGLLIGPGGKTINKIKDETGAEIDVEDDGTVFVTGKNGVAEHARDIIKSLTHEYAVGERFEGKITKLFDFGALVKIGVNTEGLVHVSEIAPFRVEKVSDILKEGETVPVVIKEINKEKGKISLSIKEADPEYAKKKVS